MFSPENIVVGVEMPESRPWDAANLSAPVRLAVREAFRVAGAMSARVTMVCVLPEISAVLFGSQENAAADAEVNRTEAMGVLEDLSGQYFKKSGVTVETQSSVVFGKPWFEILKAASGAGRNMIVCGVREKGAVSRLLFGSTGLKLLRNAACPVWLLKPRIDDDSDLDVLAATDLTEVGEDVLFAGVALGQWLPVRLNILHVLDHDLEQRLAKTGPSNEEFESYREKSKTDAEDKLHQQLSLTDYRTVQKGVQVHITEGDAEKCILSAIEELDIDLLIMATAACGGIPGMLFGNTAERLLSQLPCSILAIKPSDFVSPVKLN